jgi:hypothetical protein
MPEKTIALAAIAGNVEHLIERFVTSFQKLTPHIYIVRACGSLVPDQTLSLAAKFGATVAVYENSPDKADWPHVDDFAAARNAAWRMAERGGHDYILWADTDDVIDDASVARMKEIVEKETFDVFFCPYRLSNNGLAPWRERVVRNGTAHWEGAIHEHLVPHDKECDRLEDDKVSITHIPGTRRHDGPNERNLRILESLPFEPRWGFYLTQEYDAVGRREEAAATAIRTVEMWKADPSSLQACEVYELYILMAKWSEDPALKLSLLREAWALEPWRREALCMQSAIYSDMNLPKECLALARMAMSLPKPDLTPWTHREALYRWAGVYLLTTAMRLNGLIPQADAVEEEMLAKAGKLITVIHPTRGRPLQAAGVRTRFLERAKNPEQIEYIFAFSEDDVETRSVLGRFRHVLSPAGHLEDLGGTMVLNSNTAFRAAGGKVIVAAQDDIDPPVWWDEQILGEIGDLDQPCVLGVRDGTRNDDLLVTQVFTRPAVPFLGLPDGEYLSSDYRGQWCDTEFSVRVKAAGLVKPSGLEFTHHHVLFGKAPEDETYRLSLKEEAMAYGKTVFERRNPEVVL